jgi:predicted GIY-YIG superfamily endonuclease
MQGTPCARCGRGSHAAAACYAGTHVGTGARLGARPLKAAAAEANGPAAPSAAAHAPPATKPRYVYALELEGGKYYVGTSANVPKRVEEHREGAGSAWTKLHAVVRLLETRRCATPWDEDAVTKAYMRQYGLDAVRGGSYSQPVLPPEVRAVLDRELRGATDACFVCGDAEHWATECPWPKPAVAAPAPVADVGALAARAAPAPVVDVDALAARVVALLRVANVPSATPAAASAASPPTLTDAPPVAHSPRPADVAPAPSAPWWGKVANEFTNADSDLRSGRFFMRLF